MISKHYNKEIQVYQTCVECAKDCKISGLGELYCPNWKGKHSKTGDLRLGKDLGKGGIATTEK